MKPHTSAPPWQPLTFGGVAAFAHGSTGRLLRVQAIVAILHSVVLIWFLCTAWLPAVDQALLHLPAQAGLKQGQLIWKGHTPMVLGHTRGLGLALNASGTSSPGTTADLEILFTPHELRFTWWFGHWSLPYPAHWTIDLSQPIANAWWQAWRRPLWIGFLASAFILVMASGWMLGLATTWPVLLLGRLLRRNLTAAGAWRLSVAAGLPASLLVPASLLLYGLDRLPFIGLLLAWTACIPPLTFYLVVASFRLPRQTPAAARTPNPFNAKIKSTPRRRSKNPFAG